MTSSDTTPQYSNNFAQFTIENFCCQEFFMARDFRRADYKIDLLRAE